MTNYGIKSFRIVAYTYDADIHCKEHTERKFGLQEGRNWVRENATDSEGNSVHPVFSSDQDGDTIAACGVDIKEIICLVCGEIERNRQWGDPCWNCDSAWYTVDSDDITGLTVHDHPNWSHEVAYGPCTRTD